MKPCFLIVLNIAVLLSAALIAIPSHTQQAGADDTVKAAAPFHWGRVKFDMNENVPDKWDIHPWSDLFFIKNLRKQTNINVDEKWHEVPLDNIEEMAKFPMLFMTADGSFAFSEKQKKNLKEYLERGGFLYGDDCVFGRDGDHFFKAFKAQIEAIFGQKMVKLPNNHEIYHCLYDLNGAPYMQGQNYGGWALFIGKRMAVFLTSGDIHCGWASASQIESGKSSWFNQEKSRQAVQMGMNIIFYSMTQ